MVSDRARAESVLTQRLLPVARRLRAAADDAVAGLGLSDATGWALLHVWRLGDAVRQGDLAAALDISGASLVRLIDQLERAGLVRRAADDRDRRINRVALTPQGIATVAHIEQALAAIRTELFAGVAERDLHAAAAVLARLDERLAGRETAARNDARGDAR